MNPRSHIPGPGEEIGCLEPLAGSREVSGWPSPSQVGGLGIDGCVDPDRGEVAEEERGFEALAKDHREGVASGTAESDVPRLGIGWNRFDVAVAGKNGGGGFCAPAGQPWKAR